MTTWGINALNHGSSLAVFKGTKLQSNQFDRSDTLSLETISSALLHGYPSKIFWYEKPWIKKSRQLRAGQLSRVFDFKDIPRRYLKSIGLNDVPVVYTPHHASHAAAGYYTSPFNHCAIVVLDAIGEWECATIWEGKDGELKKLWSRSYPDSLGLFYSAFTDLLGFIPIQEEFKLQRLSVAGNSDRYYKEVSRYFNGIVSLKKNLHKGVLDWPYHIADDDKTDVAAAVQRIFEEQISLTMTLAQKLTNSNSLVYMGGCAMNNLANEKIVEPKFKYTWSLPQPGDPSSSIGAVLYHTKQRLWDIDLGVVKHIKIKV